MHGSRRVIAFCFLTVVLPTILIVVPIYLRHVNYANVMYKISESDIIQIHKGQSSVFCNKHTLFMNTSFNAFQMKGKPVLSSKRKHLKLKKSMTLPDETLEYWGFYLFKGATVELKACSRFRGSKILVVTGDKTLDTCGILEGRSYKQNLPLVNDPGQVRIILENPGTSNNSYRTNNRHDIIHKSNSSYLKEKPGKNLNYIINEDVKKQKRNIKSIPPLHNPNTVLDTGVNHGGNALLDTSTDISISSFEKHLDECFQKAMIINKEFPYSDQCSSKNYLEDATILKVIHEVLSDGYYYYIFYNTRNNNYKTNDLHAIFDIYKPTFQYANMSESKLCVNKTKCEFDVSFLSDELVIVEVPTTDGLNNEESDSSVLTSVCHPRTSVYVFFPISVLLLILLFAFL